MIADFTSKQIEKQKSISVRETQILELIVNEFTNKEIASQLFISYQTVATHRKNLRDKLSVRNTAGLIRKSYELGLLSVSNTHYKRL